MLRRDTRPFWCVDSRKAAAIPSHLIWIKCSNARSAVSRMDSSGSIRGPYIQRPRGRIQSSLLPPAPPLCGSVRSIRPTRARGLSATPAILPYPLCPLQYSILATAVVVLVVAAAAPAAPAAPAVVALRAIIHQILVIIKKNE